MFIHAIRKRAAGFCNVIIIAFITLELVDEAGVTMESVAGSGAGGGGRIMEAEARSTISWRGLGGL